MAERRIIYTSFWTDPRVRKNYTPEDKYFYLYLLTNVHTNSCGCYEISMNQMKHETGFDDEMIEHLLWRMEYKHDVIRYDAKTKEVLVLRAIKKKLCSKNGMIVIKAMLRNVKSNRLKSIMSELVSDSQDLHLKEVPGNV